MDELRARLSAIDRELGEIQAELVSTDDHDRAVQELSVSVGPFESVEEVRAFERELAGLPSVREAAVRGYEGSDRAVIDVELEPRRRSAIT